MRGVYLAAQRHGFVARLVQPSSAGLPIEAYLDIWKPAGIITDRLQFVPPKKAGVPTVLFDSPKLKMSGIPKVTVDTEAIAEAAYSVLSKFGYGHYAFAGYASDLRERNEDVWSKARATAFRRVLRESGFSGRLLTSPAPIRSAATRRKGNACMPSGLRACRSPAPFLRQMTLSPTTLSPPVCCRG